jgi:hypothetical protein
VANGVKKTRTRWEIQSVSRIGIWIEERDWNAAIETVAREVYNWGSYQLPASSILLTSLIETPTLVKPGVQHDDDNDEPHPEDARKAS